MPASCVDAGGQPGCVASFAPSCVDVPTSCDLKSAAALCDCFSKDPCGAIGQTCTGNEGPGQIGCFCAPAGFCDAAAVSNFVAAHNGCMQDSDCIPLCEIGATCNLAGINKSAQALFSSTFASCTFGQCQLACIPSKCNLGTNTCSGS
jgi:hypothetical protein